MKKQYNRKTIRKSIILMFIASTCQNMENPSYNSLTVSKINQGLLFLIRFKLFQTDIHKILHYRRRLPPLLPDQKDLRHQIRFIKHLTSQPFAKRLHGLREDRRGKPFLHPKGSAPGIITQAEHLRNQILRVKCIHNQLFIAPVEN